MKCEVTSPTPSCNLHVIILNKSRLYFLCLILPSELLNQLEALQFCRLSNSCSISYNKLTKWIQKGGPCSGEKTESMCKLIFQVRCIAAQANRSVLQFRQLHPGISYEIRRTTKDDFLCNLDEHTAMRDASRHFMLLSALAVAEALERIVARLMGIPSAIRFARKTPTEISLEELIPLLRRSTKAVKSNRTQIVEPTRPFCNWLAYSCDGTLTLR